MSEKADKESQYSLAPPLSTKVGVGGVTRPRLGFSQAYIFLLAVIFRLFISYFVFPLKKKW